MNMMSQYLGRVKANIHCVIAMSPLGDIFRQRLLKFPSLVNCCTIDWFDKKKCAVGVVPRRNFREFG